MSEILDLMEAVSSSFPFQSGDAVAASKAYLMAVEGCSFLAVRAVLSGVIRGTQTGFDGKFAPTPAQIGQWCRRQDELIGASSGQSDGQKLVPYPLGEQPPEGMVALGPVKVNFGQGTIDMSEMSPAEKEEVLRTKTLPNATGLVPAIKRMD